MGSIADLVHISQNLNCIFIIIELKNTKFLFSSPEPLAQGELLWSLDVRRVLSVVNNCFKRHLLLNLWLDFDQTW